MLSAKGNSGAGVGGRPFGRAAICNLRPVFQILCCFQDCFLVVFFMFLGSFFASRESTFN